MGANLVSIVIDICYRHAQLRKLLKRRTIVTAKPFTIPMLEPLEGLSAHAA